MNNYSATLESLAARQLPQWYQDAKFGIFIHWGIFSIPAFAPHVGKLSDAGKQDYDMSIAISPYTEWYSNSIKVPDTPSAVFHKENYGDKLYEEFKQDFLDGLKQWKPSEWAKRFRESGAKYVVLVTKHHDGFCLWPTEVANPKKQDWHTEQDIVGELAEAVRAEGLRFGIYYSGGIDWSFNQAPLRSLGDFIGSVPQGEYPEYAMAQIREIVSRYHPSILWNDISWPTNLDKLLGLFADYYNQVPDGVVNDRWKHHDLAMKILGTRPGKYLFDWFVKRQIARHPEKSDGIIPPVIPHSDFRTPEYASFSEIQTKKWEATRGMSHSFAYNRNDREEDYESVENLIHGFIDSVSKGGNLLLNVGPRGQDAGIPEEQLVRLAAFGRWLGKNGDAIYGTMPWLRAETVTEDGIGVRFTSGKGFLYVIILGNPLSDRCRIFNLKESGAAILLAVGQSVQTDVVGEDLVLIFKQPLPEDVAHVIQIRLNTDS